VKSDTVSGLKINWSSEHRDGKGGLISRQAMITPPQAPQCLTPSCLFRYLRSALFYALLASYHARRVDYAEKNRRKKILERYRTGKHAPTSIIGAIVANIKLICPFCRRVETKW